LLPVSEGPGGFADLLRRHRERAALTQEELAARAALTGKAVGALERGERRRPYPHTVRALADALGLGDADREALAAAARPDAGPSPSPDPPGHRLPAPAVPLIGRDAERDEVVGLLRSGGTRLLTLTGPGGVGKTSLALEVARTLSADFPEGATVAALAPVQDAALVLPTIARAVGAQGISPPLLDALASFLGARRCLLVLDNVEHVLDAAGDVAELLSRCPGLVVLATSRAALRVRAERERPLDPLPVPTGTGTAAVAASPAARVFLDRAAAAGRPIRLDGTTAADVSAICRRLDGLPLALELAAAHARYLSPAALLDRLDSALGSPLTRDHPLRQRTMRATLDWSHDLLTASEQRLLRRLSVFAGGFSLDAAQQVAGDGDVVPALAGLVEQSLLRPDDDASPRYRMLEPVRQYAAARLLAAGESEEVADRAADVFAGLASTARTGLRGAGQARWLDALARDHDNLGAALRRLVDRGDAGTAAVLLADTWLYWALRGRAVEGLGWADRIRLAGTSGPDPVGRAALDLAVAGLGLASGDVRGSAAAAEPAVEAARAAGTEDLLAEALLLSAVAAVFTGEFGRAEDRLAEVGALGGAPGREWVAAHAAMTTGQLRFLAGDLAAGAAAVAEAERLARELGNPFTLATILNVEATLALAADDDATALDRWTEAGELAALVGTSWTLAYTLPGLAVVAARRGRPELAAELFAAGSATAEADSVAVTFPPDLESARQWLAAVRAQLGEPAFGAAWERGRGHRPADVPRLAAAISRRSAPG
jgi:predicted ATPase/transcriptional regulator with XRE-family HTH domain